MSQSEFIQFNVEELSGVDTQKYYSLTDATYMSVAPVSSMLHWLIHETGAIIDKEDIRLVKNPVVKVVFSTRNRMSEKDIASYIVGKIANIYDLNVDTKEVLSEFIILNDKNFINATKEAAKGSSSSHTDSCVVFDNMNINKILLRLRCFERVNILLENDVNLAGVNIEHIGYSFEIPKRVLSSLEELSKYLKSIGFEARKEQVNHKQVFITKKFSQN